jgi:hypothetical protein
MTNTIEKLRNLDTNKLFDIVKNYRQHGYDEDLRDIAITILEERGITKEQLSVTGNYSNKTYEIARELYQSFTKNSQIAFVLNIAVFFTSFLLMLMFENSINHKLEFFVIRLTISILYIIFLVKAYMNQNQFYKCIGKEYSMEGTLIYLFIGLPFYFIMYFIYKNQMKESMQKIR